MSSDPGATLGLPEAGLYPWSCSRSRPRQACTVHYIIHKGRHVYAMQSPYIYIQVSFVLIFIYHTQYFKICATPISTRMNHAARPASNNPPLHHSKNRHLRSWCIGHQPNIHLGNCAPSNRGTEALPNGSTTLLHGMPYMTISTYSCVSISDNAHIQGLCL